MKISFNTAKIIGAIELLLAVILAAVRFFVKDLPQQVSSALLIIAVLLVFGWIIVTVVWCRCPHCGRVISKGVFMTDHCPYCNMPLSDGPKDK